MMAGGLGGGGGLGRIGMFEWQAPATLNQAAPVQNTWYVLLAETANCRVYDIGVNVEDANETVECRITIDGQAMTPLPAALSHSTEYWVGINIAPITRVAQSKITGNEPDYRGWVCEGHTVKIEVRKTTATGAGNLTGCATYGVMVNI